MRFTDAPQLRFWCSTHTPRTSPIARAPVFRRPMRRTNCLCVSPKVSKTACNKLNVGMASSSLDSFSRCAVLLREKIMNLRSAACGTSTSSLSGLVFRHQCHYLGDTRSRQTISIQSWTKHCACNASLKESHFRVSRSKEHNLAPDRTYKSDSQCVAEQAKSGTKCYPDVSNVMDRQILKAAALATRLVE